MNALCPRPACSRAVDRPHLCMRLAAAAAAAAAAAEAPGPDVTPMQQNSYTRKTTNENRILQRKKGGTGGVTEGQMRWPMKRGKMERTEKKPVFFSSLPSFPSRVASAIKVAPPIVQCRGIGRRANGCPGFNIFQNKTRGWGERHMWLLTSMAALHSKSQFCTLRSLSLS